MNLSIREKVGQMLVIGFPGFDLDEDTIKLIKHYKIANFILFSNNIRDKFQLKMLCEKIQKLVMNETGNIAFITLDQEGGVVSRMAKEGTKFPGAMAIAATDDPQNAYLAGKITGEELIALGINFNLSPVLDINSNDDNPVIGVRSFGKDRNIVSLYGNKMIDGLKDSGVLCCCKHFPGHGDTNVDSHLNLPVIRKNLDQLLENELYPFINAIKNNVDGVMSSHILFPLIEEENIPATLSRKIITDILKKQLGFKGLVLSDSLEMDAIKNFYGVANGAMLSVKAGIDLVFIPHKISYMIESSDLIVSAIETGEINVNEINLSVEKIFEFKEKIKNKTYDLNIVGCEKHEDINKKMIKKTIVPINFPNNRIPNLGDNIYFIGPQAYRATFASSSIEDKFNFADYLGNIFNAKKIISKINPSEKEINENLNLMEKPTSIIIGTYNGHLNKGQIKQIDMIYNLFNNINILVFALRNPYDLIGLNEKIYTFACFEYSTLIFDCIVEILKKDLVPNGKLDI